VGSKNSEIETSSPVVVSSHQNYIEHEKQYNQNNSHLNNLLDNLDNLPELNFNTTDITDNYLDFDQEINPDNNFYNNITTKCKYYSEHDLKFINNTTQLSIIHINTRSLLSKLDEINEILRATQFDIIAITETWLNEINSCNATINGYQAVHKVRNSGKGGGVSIYVKTGIKYLVKEIMTKSIDDLLECLTIEITLKNNENKIITVLYRKPGTDLNLFIEELEQLICNVKDKKVVMIGDFNIDLLKFQNHVGTSNFVNMLFSFGIIPLINRPSRITQFSATLIDNIFTNDIYDKLNSGLIISDISDHLPIFTILGSSGQNKDTCTKKQILKRDLSENALAALATALQNHDWNTVLNSDDVNVAYENFIGTFSKYLNQHCPLKAKIIQTESLKKKPWFTAGLKNACKKKNQLYNTFLSQRTDQTLKRYKVYKNKLTSILRGAEKTYYNDLLNDEQTDIKKTWKILNTIIQRCKDSHSDHAKFKINREEVTDKKRIADGFNNFFVNIGPELANNIEPVDENATISEFLGPPILDSMFLKQVNDQEIINIVQNFKNKTSYDVENINMTIIKSVIHSIIDPLVHICNKSFLSGTFPEKMKIAKVTPLYKEKDKGLFSNYRPISLLPQFSKIIEKLFSNRLDEFIEKNKILNDCQYGFRTGRSTSMALLELVEKIITSVDQNLYTIGVFIDLKKAFDTIDHHLLLQKLYHYGIRGVAYEWIHSYILNRKQYVNFENHYSELLNIVCGVPQGSILGPKLFILYINDICNVSSLLHFILFADDTNIFRSDKNLNSLINTINSELKKLEIWFAINKLSLNIKKTSFMVFGNRNIPQDIILKINNIQIERVYVTKFLGVFIDNKLKWKDQTEKIRLKLSKTIGIIYRAKNILDKKRMLILYYTLFLPYLTYCCEIWGNNYKSNINDLFLLQKKIIRIICNVSYTHHTQELFLELKVLKLFDLIDLNTSIIIYKAVKNILPTNLKHILQIHFSNNSRQKDKINLQHLYARTTQRSMCLSVCGVKLWNSLSVQIKKSTHIHEFKYKFKERVFNNYSNSI